MRLLASARMIERPLVLGALAMLLVLAMTWPAAANPETWKSEWPDTDFSRKSVAWSEIKSVIPKDRIRSIEGPEFAPVAKVTSLGPKEPVISIAIGNELRAYPLRILMYHEIVNDEIAGTPVAVTFCPLCNSAVVFDRRLDGKVLEFGTTGKLRNSDLIMYDRQTETWWQQFMGEGIVGELTGKLLKFLPSRVESFARFKARGEHGLVMIPGNLFMLARYGGNPYPRYDTQSRPLPQFFSGALPKGVPALERVVVVGKEAWAFSFLRAKRKVVKGDLIITWEPGQNSALDTATISDGRDVGNVIVQRKTAAGLVDAVHDVSFAFAFHAFHPDGTIHTK